MAHPDICFKWYLAILTLAAFDPSQHSYKYQKYPPSLKEKDKKENCSLVTTIAFSFAT